ncbi:MAG: hypothetical protein Q9177_001181 [Variospora cf. flavescens]
METTIKKDELPVHAASEQDTIAAVETAKATRLDAGLRSLDHFPSSSSDCAD